MDIRRRLAFALAGLTLSGALSSPSRADAAPDERVGPALRAVAERRVFFGHQSVGVNILDGLRELAARNGVPLRIEEVRAGVPAGTFGHGFVAENENPRLKMQSFLRAFETGAAKGAEIALLKFCYIDFKKDTDVAALFRDYQAMVARFRASYPGVVLVHVTAPLLAPPTGVKNRVKQAVGRDIPEVLENARRDDYNALLRGAYAGREPLFDLARLEATRPDGGEESMDWKGRAVPALVPAYTTDGGHLAPDGQLRAAQELVTVLAAIPGRPPAAGGKAP